MIEDSILPCMYYIIRQTVDTCHYLIDIDIHRNDAVIWTENVNVAFALESFTDAQDLVQMYLSTRKHIHIIKY